VLLREARRGDAQAWQRLDRRYRNALRMFARGRVPNGSRARFDTDDLLQTTFFAAWRELDQYAWQGDQSFLWWLRRILENRLRNRMRHDAALRRKADEDAQSLETGVLQGVRRPTAPSASEIASRAEHQARLMGCLLELDDRDQELILRHVMDREPTAERAEREGVHVTTIRRQVRVALDRLNRAVREARAEDPEGLDA
jgi:RNA polymerase sigma factor (sigma-70 family)